MGDLGEVGNGGDIDKHEGMRMEFEMRGCCHYGETGGEGDSVGQSWW